MRMTDKPRHNSKKARVARARGLRRRQTPAEARLWAHLRDRRLGGFKFRRQHPIGRFVVDFYCTTTRLAVEIDGDAHVDREANDAERDHWLQSHGCRVIRFTNRHVNNQLDAVLETILNECQEHD